MTFDPAVPLNSDSPSIFPSQNQGNMSRIQTIVGADHQFNLTPAANDGYHKLIHMTLQAPSGALASTGRSYVKVSGGAVNQFYMDDAGVEYQMTPTMPIRAAVSFNGTGAVGLQALYSQYNVTSVDKTALGFYTINFPAMPNVTYIAHITGMLNGVGPVFGFIQGGLTVATSQTTVLLKIGFQTFGNNPSDVRIGNVTIFSVT